MKLLGFARDCEALSKTVGRDLSIILQLWHSLTKKLQRAFSWCLDVGIFNWINLRIVVIANIIGSYNTYHSIVTKTHLHNFEPDSQPTLLQLLPDFGNFKLF